MSTQQLIRVALIPFVILGGGLAAVYRHWYSPRRLREHAERLRREEEAGVPPSANDYQFAISFDADVPST